MAKLPFLLLIAILIVQANCIRLIYREPSYDETTKVPDAKFEPKATIANIIGAPQNCNRGERLDRMNKCRKVSDVRSIQFWTTFINHN